MGTGLQSSGVTMAAPVQLPDDSSMKMPTARTRACAPLRKSTREKRGNTEVVPETPAELSIQARSGLGRSSESGNKFPARCTASVVLTTLRLGTDGREKTAVPPPRQPARNAGSQNSYTSRCSLQLYCTSSKRTFHQHVPCH